jgi:SET domain-containing protein
MLAAGIEVVQISEAIGLGLMAVRRFDAGEVIWQESGAPRSRRRRWDEVMTIPEPYRALYKHFMYQVGPDSFESLPDFDLMPPDKWHTAAIPDFTLFMNHSCDPTCWYTDPDLFEFSARRRIRPGEWVTYDYAMTETRDDQAFRCHCGAPGCRGRVLARDWQLADVRRSYWGHVARHVQDLMDRLGVPAAE